MPKKFTLGFGPWINREATAIVAQNDTGLPSDFWRVYEIGSKFTVLREAKQSEVAKAFKQSAPKTPAGSRYYWARPSCDGGGDIYPALILKTDVEWCPFQVFVAGTGQGHHSWHDGSKGSWEDRPRPPVAPQEGAGSKRPAADTADVPVSTASKAPDAATTAMARIKGVKPVCDMRHGNCPGEGKCATCRENVRDMLGVRRDADVEAIKKAYKKLLLILHPDKCTLEGAQEVVKKVIAHYGNAVPKNA